MTERPSSRSGRARAESDGQTARRRIFPPNADASPAAPAQRRADGGTMDIVERYYEAQRRCRDNDTSDPERTRRSEAWLMNDTVDSWRHRRMYGFIDPFLDHCPAASWLTIGDGRFACDAQYIGRKTHDVTASDISEGLLRRALERGYIPRYSVENAECLSFEDASFDFVLCKESYHHLPRPMMGLYEMLRVARVGVLLIEPNDQICDQSIRMRADILNGNIGLRSILRAITKRLGVLGALRRARGLRPEDDTYYEANFEPSGNYVYAISRLEIAKAALGLGLPAIAFAGLNDYYEDGVELEKASETSTLFRKVKGEIAAMDRRSIRSILIAALFKRAPEGNLRDTLRNRGYEIEYLPANPFVKG